MELFCWNMLIYGVAFYLGCNFTHLDQGVLQSFKIDTKSIKNFSPFLWAVLIGCVVLILSIVKIVATYYF